MGQQTFEHFQVETKSFQRSMAFWQALGFMVRETRGHDGHRVCQLISDDADVLPVPDALKGEVDEPRMHLKIQGDLTFIKRLKGRRRELRVEEPKSGPWKDGWYRVKDPDGNVYSLELARAA